MPVTVTVAFKAPSEGEPASVHVSCVAVAAVTVAVPELRDTELFAGVVEKPVPLMMSCVAFCAKLVVLDVMLRFTTVATWTAGPLLWVLEVTTAVRLPAVGLTPKVTTI